MNSIRTVSDGTVSNNGVMFDIIASPSKTIRVRNLSIYTKTANPCDLQVFTKKQSHEYFEQTRDAWLEIVNIKTQCLGPGLETVIDESMFSQTDHLAVKKGERRAFYIRVEGTELVYSTTGNYNQVFIEDNNVQILEGSGVNGFFMDYVVPRMWNGVLYYDVIGSDDDQFDECSKLMEVNVNEGSSGSGNKNFGVMFNVKSKADEEIIIQGLSFYTDQSVSGKYEIYSIPSGFEYGKGSLSLWQKVSDGTLDGNFDNIILSGPNFDAVYLQPGRTQGFYITLPTKSLLYRTTALAVGSTYIRNDDIIISVGIGVGEYPLGTTFYNSRGLYGKVLYGFKSACNSDTAVTYNFVVYYPKEWDIDEVFQEISFNVQSLVEDTIARDEYWSELVDMQKLEFASIESTFDRSGKSSCSEIDANMNCSLVATKLALTHNKEMDPGIVTFGLLKLTEKITEHLNSRALVVYYAGDEPLDTTLVVTLSGVPKKRMGLEELRYFREKTKKYLIESVESGSVEILAVEVENQSLKYDVEVYASESSVRHLEDSTTTSIDLKTVVTGKHRPPSPGLDFDILIEDSVNSDTSTYKEELSLGAKDLEGGSYFESIEEIRAIMATIAPTVAPQSDVLVYEGSGYGNELRSEGLGLISIVGMIIGVAIVTFGLVFGTFVWRKRQNEKKKFRIDLDDEDNDEGGALFHDIFKEQQNDSKKKNERWASVQTTKTSNDSDQSSRDIAGRHRDSEDERDYTGSYPRRNNQESSGEKLQKHSSRDLVRGSSTKYSSNRSNLSGESHELSSISMDREVSQGGQEIRLTSSGQSLEGEDNEETYRRPSFTKSRSSRLSKGSSRKLGRRPSFR